MKFEAVLIRRESPTVSVIKLFFGLLPSAIDLFISFL